VEGISPGIVRVRPIEQRSRLWRRGVRSEYPGGVLICGGDRMRPDGADNGVRSGVSYLSFGKMFSMPSQILRPKGCRGRPEQPEPSGTGLETALDAMAVRWQCESDRECLMNSYVGLGVIVVKKKRTAAIIHQLSAVRFPPATRLCV
jgi:hypothetical protein